MKTPVSMLEEIGKFKRLADIPESMLIEAVDVMRDYTSVLRREVMRRQSLRYTDHFRPDPKPKKK